MTHRADDLAVNRALWTLVNAEFTDARASRAWVATEITWGLFEVPEHELHAPPDATTHEYYDIASAAWAQKWPAEDLWSARLTSRQLHG